MKKQLPENYIKTLFESFNDAEVLVIGDVMIDGYIWGAVERISAEAPVPIVAVKKKEKRLGGAANVALNVQALGAKPILCSVVGKDPEGKTFLELLTKQKMSKEGILQLKGRTTTVKTRMLGNSAQLLRVDEENDSEITPTDAKTFITHISSIIEKRNIKVIIFEDYDKGALTTDVIEGVLALANKHKIPTCVDPKKRNFTKYKGVSLFKPNLKELVDGVKIDLSGNDFDELRKVVSSFRKKQKIETVLLTLAERGVLVDSNNNKKQFPAQKRSIVDVSGAGDTVISVAALCKAFGSDDSTTAILANLAGGLVCEEPGVVPINKKRLEAEALKFDFWVVS
jgi:rfaE bifunctional protein kinase chain/domain